MTDEIKKAFENAKTDEEKKAVAEKFKDEMKQLSDEELEEVTGGFIGLLILKAREVEAGAQLRARK